MGEDFGHVVYRGPEGETTEWDDLQRQYGNKPPAPEKFIPDAFTPAEDRGLRAAVERGGRAGGTAHIDAARGMDQLHAMEDEDAFADDTFLEEYRRKRLEEMKTAAAIPRFGTVVDITRDSFMAHVTDPSSEHYVLVLLHRPQCRECELLAAAYAELARKHPHTKFTSIPGKECIPGYPDRNMPTLLVYKDRDPVRTFMGLDHYGGTRMTPEGLELALNECGNVCRGAKGGDDDEDGGDDARDSEGWRRKEYAEMVVRRMIEDGREHRQRHAESKEDDDDE